MKLGDEPLAGRVKRVVLLPSREIQRDTSAHLVGRDLIGDHLLRVRHTLADGVPHERENLLDGLWLQRNIFVHGLEVSLSHVQPRTVKRSGIGCLFKMHHSIYSATAINLSILT